LPVKVLSPLAIAGVLALLSRSAFPPPSIALPALEVPAPLEQQTPASPVAVKGGVKIKGELPKRGKLKVEADPKCAALHGDAPLLSDDVVADAAGRVQWAIVYVKDGLGDLKFVTPKSPVVVEQKGCRFDPHVFGVMAGQEVMFRNGDALMHIIHVIPKNNREFGFSQEKPGEERAKVFANRETIRVRCEIHPWMAAWAVVLDHPFYSTTGPDGKFSIRGLPPGKYTLEVWHEKYKSVTQEIQVRDKEVTVADFVLEEKKD
jgi:plastocyanin